MNNIIKYQDFYASINFSVKDDVFHGKIEGIDDSITFEGDSVASLKKSFKEAVIDYLEICKDLSKDPQKSFKGSFNVRIKPDLHKNAAYKSLEKGLSLNKLVEEAISDYVSKN